MVYRYHIEKRFEAPTPKVKHRPGNSYRPKELSKRHGKTENMYNKCKTQKLQLQLFHEEHTIWHQDGKNENKGGPSVSGMWVQ